MTSQTTNPFVLPGMGQASADLSGNPLLASMEMMRKAWAGLAGPGGLAQALPMTPPMNLEDLERRIAELRTVESWLRMNLSMLGSAIQGLEVQRATIATLRSFVGSVSSMDTGVQQGGPSPLEVALGLKPAPKTAAGAPPETAPEQAPAPEAQDKPGSAPGAGERMAQELNSAAQSASQAWWDLLQQQFNQIAAATAATMPAGVAPSDSAADAAQGGAAASASAPAPSARPRTKTQAKPRKPAGTKGTAGPNQS